ncbi:MAG: hypothetical protein DDT22_01358 [candidate division WS2 bacterium]|nr:hypothetical protein [Candidatus Lithacetigena glycinireducens]
MKKKFMFTSTVLIVALLFSGCATITKKEPPYKEIALGKIAAEELVSVAKRMHRDKLLSDADLERVRIAYESARRANDVVISMFITSLNLGIDPRTNIEYNRMLDSYMRLMQDLLNLSVELKIIKEGYPK